MTATRKVYALDISDIKSNVNSTSFCLLQASWQVSWEL